jgi:hypothetical protein
MKTKSNILTLLALASCIATTNAATIIISNANDGLTDTLYADSNNVLMNGGLVATGYFTASTTVGDIDTIPELRSALANFTIITSISPGSESGTLGGSFAGYADQFPNATTVTGSPINSGALLGRSIFTIVTSAADLNSTLSTSGFALFQSGTLSGDDPNVVEITATPAGVTPIIGSTGTTTGNFGGQGVGTYNTLKMSAIPEPSTALLGALGVLALLRRRRN